MSKPSLFWGSVVGFAAALLASVGLTTPAQADLPPDAFVSTWITSDVSPGSSEANQIRLPLYSGGVYNFTVDWGDQSTSTVTSWDDPDAIHTYAAEGEYTLTITGGIKGWRFAATGDKWKIRDIAQWGTLRFGSGGSYFEGAKYLTASATDAPDLSEVSDLSRTFAYTWFFDGDLSSWDTSRVSNMNAMFMDAYEFNGDISSWDTSLVRNMSSMFMRARKFNQPIGGWDTSFVTDMRSMFDGASSFNQPVGGWNTAGVTSMRAMFSGATLFNQPLSSWNTASVTDMAGMFEGVYEPASFNQPIGGWDTWRVTDMSSMFANSRFNQPIGGWDTRSVTDMSSMFKRTPFNQPIGTWLTSHVTDMSEMFYYSPAFDQDIGGWSVTQVSDMTNMFEGAGLGTSNYDALLNGWSQLPVLQAGVVFNAGSSHYSESAAASRSQLISEHHWTITDGGPAAPGFSVSPDPVGFGEQVVGTNSSYVTVTVTNSGSAALSFSAGAVSLTGAQSGQFGLADDTCSSQSVAPAGTCTVKVRFAPTGTGLKSASLQFVSNASGSPHTVALTGTGTAPGFSVSPDPVGFGEQVVGTNSSYVTVTVTNTGSAALSFSAGAVSLTGAQSGQFGLADDTCSSQSVAPAGTCTVKVRFAPTGTGLKSASLQFVSNASGSPHTVALTGTGTAPGFSVSPDPVGFGEQVVGTNSSYVTVTVTNTGSAALNFSAGAVSLAGFQSGQFGLGEDTCSSQSVAPAGTCTVEVRFAPSSVGSTTATLQFTSNALGSPHVIYLYGTGTAPGFSAAPSGVEFGEQVVGTNSSFETVTVTNWGSAALTFAPGAVSLSGSQPGQFGLGEDTCSGVSVAPASTCTVKVRFSPTSVDSTEATLQFVSNAAGSPHVVYLHGTGTGPRFQASPDPVGFGEQLVGTNSSFATVTVTNSGSAALSFSAGAVSLTGAGSGQFGLGEDTCSSQSVAPAGTCTVKVRFAPTSTGLKSASLQFASNAAGSPHTVALTGTGTAPGFFVSPDPVGFGEQVVGTNSSYVTVTVTNSGSAALSFSAGAVSLTGAQSGQFGLADDTCSSQSVAPAGTCTVKVRFSPSSTGLKSASLQFASNAAGTPHTVALSGSGTASPPPPPPPPPPQPQTVAKPVKSVKAKKTAKLPAQSQQGAPVTWTTSTKKVCKVQGSKLKALKKGTCTLKASAPAISGYLAYSGTAKVKVK